MVLFFGYRHAAWIAYELERRGLFTFRQPIILEKEDPMPHIKKTGFRSCMEFGVWLVNDGGEFRAPKTFNFLGQDLMKSIIPYRIGHEGRKGKKHPTEKPLAPIARLIKIFTNPGEVVLDNFAGS